MLLQRLSVPIMILPLLVACTGADQLGEPWGSPMQYTTALPNVPYAPRDLAMFDGVNGRVVMWADLMRLVRRTDVIVVDGTANDANAVACRKALIVDVQSAFAPVAVIECGESAQECATQVRNASHENRRVVLVCTGAYPLSEVSKAIRCSWLFSSVTTVAMVDSQARFLSESDRDRGDVVVYTKPMRILSPTDLPPAARAAG